MGTKEIFKGFQEKLDARPEKIKNLKAVLQYNITGADPGNYYIEISDGTGTVHEGIHPKPNLSMTMDSALFADMVAGKEDAASLFMAGKMKVSGNQMIGMKMQGVLW